MILVRPAQSEPDPAGTFAIWTSRWSFWHKSRQPPSGSLQPDAVKAIPLGHVGEDDLIADLQALHHLNGAD